MASFLLNELGNEKNVVSRVKSRKRKKARRRSSGAMTAEDIASIFSAMPMPNRGYRRDNGFRPEQLGGGLDEFYAKNPHLKGSSSMPQPDNRARDGAAAVDFAKQTKGYTGADGVFVPPTIPMPGALTPSGLPQQDVVTGADGYKTVFDKTGKPVGTNAPVPRPQNGGMFDYSATQADPKSVGNLLTQRSRSTNAFPALNGFSQTAAKPSQLVPNSVGSFPARNVADVGSPSMRGDVNKSPMASVATPTRTGTIPDALVGEDGNIFSSLFRSGNAALYGLNDAYINNVGRPLDELLFGIPQPAQPSNVAEQYAKQESPFPSWLTNMFSSAPEKPQGVDQQPILGPSASPRNYQNNKSSFFDSPDGPAYMGEDVFGGYAPKPAMPTKGPFKHPGPNMAPETPQQTQRAIQQQPSKLQQNLGFDSSFPKSPAFVQPTQMAGPENITKTLMGMFSGPGQPAVGFSPVPTVGGSQFAPSVNMQQNGLPSQPGQTNIQLAQLLSQLLGGPIDQLQFGNQQPQPIRLF